MSSIFVDVQWDRAATDALVRQLLAAAGAVGDVVAVLDGAGSGPGSGPGRIEPAAWGGPHRMAFDAECRVLVQAARRVADSLVDAARRTAALAEAAAGEQRLRERLRRQVELEAACAVGRPC